MPKVQVIYAHKQLIRQTFRGQVFCPQASVLLLGMLYDLLASRKTNPLHPTRLHQAYSGGTWLFGLLEKSLAYGVLLAPQRAVQIPSTISDRHLAVV